MFLVLQFPSDPQSWALVLDSRTYFISNFIIRVVAWLVSLDNAEKLSWQELTAPSWGSTGVENNLSAGQVGQAPSHGLFSFCS